MTYALDHASRLLATIAQSLYQSINHRGLGEAVRLLGIGEEYARETMRRWGPLAQDSTEGIIRQLVWEYPDHGHIIDVTEARRIGLSNVARLPLGLEELLFDVVDRDQPLVTAIPLMGGDAGGDTGEARGGINGDDTDSACGQ